MNSRWAPALSEYKVFRFFSSLELQQHTAKPLFIRDALLAVLLIGVAAVVIVTGAHRLGTTLDNARSFNLWFQADLPRVVANLTDASSSHHRVSVHAIAPTVLTSVVLGLHQFGMDLGFAGHLWMFALAGLSVGLFYLLLRLLGVAIPPSIVFTLLFIMSAAFIHWAPVEELSVPAMLSIVLSLLLLAYGKTRHEIWWCLVSLLTLGVTITNWSFGLIATLVRWPLEQFVRISAIALGIAVVIATLQYGVFHKARPFYIGAAVLEYRYAQPIMSRGWSPLKSWKSMFVSTIVAPAPYVELQGEDQVVTNQESGFFDQGFLAIAAAFAWLSLFAIGIWGAVRNRELRPVAVALGLMVISQAALHSVYGDPTFMYSPHFLPPLLAVAAFSWFTPVRWFALVLALGVLFLGGKNNLAQFDAAAALATMEIEKGGNRIRADEGFPPRGALLP